MWGNDIQLGVKDMSETVMFSTLDKLQTEVTPSSKTILYKFLFWCALLMLVGLMAFVAIEYFRFGYDRKVILVEKSVETAAYELFDKQFSQLLTVFSILVAVFGLAIPFATYLIQRQTLHDERARMMADVAKHEEDLLKMIGALKSSIEQSDHIQREEFESRQKKISERQKEIESEIQKYIDNKGLYERELSYRLGRQFFLSGSAFPDDTLAKIMSYVHALEQFAMYSDYKKSTRWIDSTLANILDLVVGSKKNGTLGIHRSYRLEVLQTLRHVAEQEWLAPYLRDAARDIATKIRKLKPAEVVVENAIKSNSEESNAAVHPGAVPQPSAADGGRERRGI